MTNQKKVEKKEKIPTALKRDLQSEKRRIRNKIVRSQVNTAIKKYREAKLVANQDGQIEQRLKDVQSLLDKAVKKGVFKLNKASRLKSRLTLSK